MPEGRDGGRPRQHRTSATRGAGGDRGGAKRERERERTEPLKCLESRPPWRGAGVGPTPLGRCVKGAWPAAPVVTHYRCDELSCLSSTAAAYSAARGYHRWGDETQLAHQPDRMTTTQRRTFSLTSLPSPPHSSLLSCKPLKHPMGVLPRRPTKVPSPSGRVWPPAALSPALSERASRPHARHKVSPTPLPLLRRDQLHNEPAATIETEGREEPTGRSDYVTNHACAGQGWGSDPRTGCPCPSTPPSPPPPPPPLPSPAPGFCAADAAARGTRVPSHLRNKDRSPVTPPLLAGRREGIGLILGWARGRGLYLISDRGRRRTVDAAKRSGAVAAHVSRPLPPFTSPPACCSSSPTVSRTVTLGREWRPWFDHQSFYTRPGKPSASPADRQDRARPDVCGGAGRSPPRAPALSLGSGVPNQYCTIHQKISGIPRSPLDQTD